MNQTTYGTMNTNNPVTNTSLQTPAQPAEKKDAFSYDYITAIVNGKFALEFIDCYQALGWELAKTEKGISLKTVLTFKRDRKIKNMNQLNRIQVKLDEALNKINKFELNKTKLPFAAAVALGSAGTLTFGGGMCLVLLNSAIGAIIGGVALGIAGLTIAAAAYLVYKKLSAKKSKKMNISIDNQRDEISGLCAEAQKYL